MRSLLIGTTNQNKFLEITAVLKDLNFTFLNLNNISCVPVEENADTFMGNAILKAKGYGKQTGLLTMADDSGLCIDALGGKPGVYSARFYPGNVAGRNNKILEELKNIPKEKRTARYKAAIAIFNPENEKLFTSEGDCEGLITDTPVGENGFAYDPIFFSLDLGKTMAQASMEEKNSVSHRGKALEKIKKILKKNF